MLAMSNLELEGRQNSAIDDAKNLSRVVIKLMDEGYQFTQGMVQVRQSWKIIPKKMASKLPKKFKDPNYSWLRNFHLFL